MKNFFKQFNLKKISAMGLILVFSYPVYTEVTGWLWKVNDKEYTVDYFKKDYESFIELMAWQMGVSKNVLKTYIGKGDLLDDAKARMLMEQLSPEKFAESFLIISLLSRNAKDTGYLDKPENKMKSEFVQQYIMSQMYLNEVIEKINIEIKDEDVEQAWVDERKKNPNLQSVPIEQGLIMLKQKMVHDKKEVLKSEFIKSLKEKYNVKKSDDLGKILRAVTF
jgi:hypothetical protein